MKLNIEDLPLDKIHPSKDNPRSNTDPNIKQLAASIETVGVICPIAVTKNSKNGIYEIIYGERRYRASLLAKKKTIPSIIITSTEKDVTLARAAENKNRLEIDPFAESVGVGEMMKTMNMKEIAAVLGMPIQAVRLRANLSLLLPEFHDQIKKDRKAQKLNSQMNPGIGMHNWPIHYFELIARYPEPAQKRTLSWGINSYHVPSLAQVERILGEQETPLADATWDVSDASLGKAGPCTECEKRKSIVHDLFEKVKANTPADKDTCQDVVCFRRKRDIAQGRQLKELKDKHNAIVVSLCDKYHITYDLQEKVSAKAAGFAKASNQGIETYWEIRNKKEAPKAAESLITKDGKLILGIKLGTYQKPSGSTTITPHDTVGYWKQQWEHRTKLIAQSQCMEIIRDRTHDDLLPKTRLEIFCALTQEGVAVNKVGLPKALSKFTENSIYENLIWLWEFMITDMIEREGYNTPFRNLKEADEFYKTIDVDFSQVVREVREKNPIPEILKDLQSHDKQPEKTPNVYDYLDK